MSVLSPPALPGFRRSRFRLSPSTQVFASLGGRISQTRALAVSRWAGEYELPPMRREEAEPWLAILARAHGSMLRIYLGDPARATPQGAALGTPLVSGPRQTGSVLQTTGWTPSGSPTLAAGDYVSWPTSYGIEVRKISADATASGTLLYNAGTYNSDGYGYGELLLEVVPDIRESPADGAVLTVRGVCCPMRLLSDEAAAWDVDSASVFGVRFEAEETLESTAQLYSRGLAATASPYPLMRVNGIVLMPLPAIEAATAGCTFVGRYMHQALAEEEVPTAGIIFGAGARLTLQAIAGASAAMTGLKL